MKKNERGAVLIIALIMLLILTVLGVAVMESSVIEERMAGNAMDRNRAFQAAESGLRAAETVIDNYTSTLTTSTLSTWVTSGTPLVLGSISTATDNWWTTVDETWWTDTTNGKGGQDSGLSLTNVTNSPRYVVELYDTICDEATASPTESDCKYVYRVTVFAWGQRNSTVVLQSLYSRRF